MLKQILQALAPVALSGFILHSPAAAQVLFSGSGTWDADAAVTSLSAPGASWAFSFTLPDVVAANPTAAPAGFSFTLAETPQLFTPLGVEFFATPDSGMFDILVADGLTFSLYGDVVLGGTALALGSYTVFAGVDGGLPMGSGTLSLQAVPEPASAASLALGLLLLGGLAARRAR